MEHIRWLHPVRPGERLQTKVIGRKDACLAL